MKVISNGNCDVIRFTHMGIHFNSEYKLVSANDEFEDLDIRKPNICRIEFTDTAEIEILIRMLETFKSKCEFDFLF